MHAISRKQFFNPPMKFRKAMRQQLRRQFTAPLPLIIGGIPARVQSEEVQAFEALKNREFTTAEPKPECRGPIKAGISRAAVLRKRRKALPKR